jgi:hypothetical protein
MGGFGVYQAYRRMLREERSAHGAEYVMLYIWGDDHIRSLLRCRHAITNRVWNHQGGSMFHGNFWSHIEMDLDSGRLVERENLLSTPAALYQMTDPQFMVDHLMDDLALRLYAFKLGYIRDLDREQTSRLAACLDYRIDWNHGSALTQQAAELLDRYSLRATRYILAKAREFTKQNGKKLLVILFDPYRVMADMQKGGTRYDQEIVDYLKEEKFDYFDMNEVQLRDYRKYSLTFEAYMKEYFIGHYNPRGNHFFAYAIKNVVVNLLEPKPMTYRKTNAESDDFKGYLAGYP